MNDKVNLNLKGEITITNISTGKVLEKFSNAITASAIEILLNALPAVPNQAFVDTIRFIGTFGDVSKGITNSQVNASENSVTFITEALEDDFNGTIQGLQLEMANMGLTLATKTGINIEKDSTVRVEIRWKITINQC